QRRLHSAGSRGLQRKLRRIQPQVHAGSDFSPKLEIVIIQKYHRHGFTQRLLGMKNTPNNVFPAAIVRMRLPGINNLEVPGILGHLPQTIEVGKDQVSALVSGSAARETDRENLGIKFEPGLLANGL